MLSVGDVRVLLVSVCVPVSVVTVLSIAKVTALPEPLVSTPVPPVNVRVSESRSMLNAPPESAWKSKSCAVTCESTYALIDCCVASLVALLEDISSSSLIPVTVAPSPAMLTLVLATMVVPVIAAAVDAPTVVPSIAPPFRSTVGIVTVPVNVGLAMSALVADAVAILSNSVSISVPLTILLALPEGKLSLAAKFVVFV